MMDVFQVWCVLLSDKVSFRMHWPLSAVLRVNGTFHSDILMHCVCLSTSLTLYREHGIFRTKLPRRVLLALLLMVVLIVWNRVKCLDVWYYEQRKLCRF